MKKRRDSAGGCLKARDALYGDDSILRRRYGMILCCYRDFFISKIYF